MVLCASQSPALGGAYEEFVFAPRLDNLLMSYLGLESLIDSCTDSLKEEPNVRYGHFPPLAHFSTHTFLRMVALFDHEEVGSSSRPGAGSTLLPSILERLTNGSREEYLKAISRSFLVRSLSMIDLSPFQAHTPQVSADMAHAVHPNYSEKHEVGK